MATEALAASAAALSEPVKASVLDTLTEPSTTLVMVQLATTPCALRMLASSVVQNCKHQLLSVLSTVKKALLVCLRHTVKQFTESVLFCGTYPSLLSGVKGSNRSVS